MIFGHNLNLFGYLIFTLVSLVISWLGFAWFQKTRKGFADVL
jgi:lipopolysaccharide transport system permease protein